MLTHPCAPDEGRSGPPHARSHDRGRDCDFRGHLHHRRRRQDSRLSHRPRRCGAARRQPDGRYRGAVARRSLPRGRSQHDHAAARHDDRGGEPARVGLLPAGQWLDRRACAPSARPVGRGRAGIGAAVGIPGQRCDLFDDDAAGARTRRAAQAQSDSLPAGDRHGFQHRQCRHDHRQSAEHHHRQRVGHFLCGFHRGARAGRRLRAGGDLRADRAGVPARSFSRASRCPPCTRPRTITARW